MTPFDQPLAELADVTSRIDPDALGAACQMIAASPVVIAHGCGREGLQLRGFVMRLHHLGRNVAMQGDMTAPLLGPGDLLLASAGPGELATVTALIRVARAAGARVLFLTAEPATPAASLADLVLSVPAQTMARDRQGGSSLPMGSLYEGALFLLFEVMVLRLAAILGETPETMRARHTNME